MLRYGHPQCTPPTSKSNCNGMAAPSASSTIEGRIIPIFKIVFPGHLELWWLWAAILEKLDTTLNRISQLSRRPWWFQLSHRRSTGRTASPTCLTSKKLPGKFISQPYVLPGPTCNFLRILSFQMLRNSRNRFRNNRRVEEKMKLKPSS